MLYILEGLPGAGKTSILDEINKKNGFGVVEQVIPHQFCDEKQEEYYFYSDCLKYEKAILLQNKSSVIMDRGHLSTLAYNYAFDKLFKSKNYPRIKKKFEQKSDLFVKPCVILYITVDINESLARKDRINKNDSVWCDKDFLFYMKEFYETKMPEFSSGMKIVIINGMEAKSRVFDRITKIISGAE